jgi:hypothetical protein
MSKCKQLKSTYSRSWQKYFTFEAAVNFKICEFYCLYTFYYRETDFVSFINQLPSIIPRAEVSLIQNFRKVPNAQSFVTDTSV